VLAAHFTALVTSETGHRLYQIDPAPMALAEVRQMVSRAVDTFLQGAAPKRAARGRGAAATD
jgi:hypothetical protein